MPVKTGTPIQLTLYNADESVKKELSRQIIRWGILKKVIRLTKSVDLSKPDELEEADLDIISGLIAEVFGNEISVQDLDDGADLSDMITCLQMIVGKASGIVQNPTPPAR